MAQYEDITIDRGSDVAIEMHLVKPDGSTKDISGHTITAKLKKTYNSSDSDTTDFSTAISSATQGIALLSLTNTQTEALKPGRYVYDVEMSYVDSDSNTIIERVLEGKIHVTPSVTR